MAMGECSSIKNVLLVGNGIIRSCGGVSWNDLLRTMCVRDDLPVTLSSPMPLRALLVTGNDVEAAMERLRPALMTNELKDESAQVLDELLSIGFGDILTTNYGYEIEYRLSPKLSRSFSGIRKVASWTKKDQRYLLHTFNFCSGSRVWHIHGEARRPGGMVIDHRRYCQMLEKCSDYVNRAMPDYERGKARGDSWIDAFMAGNVYILGFGLDCCEIDLWYLLSRRKRIPDGKKGKIIYYDISSYGFNEKKELLSLMDVEWRDLGFQQNFKSSSLSYKDFYPKVVEDIKASVGYNSCSHEQ